MQQQGLEPGERSNLFQHMKGRLRFGPDTGWLHAAAQQLLMQQQCFGYAASLVACWAKA